MIITALVAGMTTTPTAAADTAPASSPGDRGRAMTLWRFGGPATRAAAEKALTGSAADLQAFLATGHQRSEKIDHRVQVTRMLSSGGPSVAAAAQKALDANTDTALTQFLATGWRPSADIDLRVHVTQLLSTGGPQLQKAAQQALDANNADALRTFLDSDWRGPWQIDLRVRVTQIFSTGGPEVQKVAQQALDANNADALTQFLNADWAVAQARDQETTTIAQLVAVAKDATQQAALEGQAAKDAADRAVAAAELARQSAQAAKDAATAAQGKAGEAASAAARAAEAARGAAAAAQEAIGAANAATQAATVAANAAARASVAASRAGQAAANADSAAAAAAGDASQVQAALQAAQAADSAATQARQAADTAGQAMYAADRAGAAASAAKNASAQATSAANSVQEAAGLARAAGADASEATAAAATATANAARASRAAGNAQTLAFRAGQAAGQARTAANQAADYAEAAARAARDAAAHAGEAADAANKATEHANAATEAAKAAVTAATQARQIFDAARTADDERLAVEAEQADDMAKQLSTALGDQRAQVAWDADQATRRDAETTQLITETTAPGTDAALAVTDARKVALALSATGGPWTKAAATSAMSGSDAEVVEFVRSGIQIAAGQDDRVILNDLINTGTPKMQQAGKAALAGTDADVQKFLQTRDYPGRYIDDRVAVTRVLSLADSTGGTVVAQVAQKALDASTDEALRQFLSVDQYTAADRDDRVKVTRLLSTGGPETKAAAQAALDGPPALRRQLLQTGQYTAAQRDQNTASHVSLVSGLVNQGMQAAATATQHAFDAQAAAARARKAATDADTYARQALDSANDAARYFHDAQTSANDAEASARQAAESAKTAANAAATARTAADNANHSALWAQESAQQAMDSAARAADAYRNAFNSMISAGKGADEALQVARHAGETAINKINEEKAKLKTAREEACKPNYPDTVSQEYKDCVLLITGTDSDKARILLYRGQACANWNAPGSGNMANCTSDSNLYSADFASTWWMRYLPNFKGLADMERNMQGLIAGLVVAVALGIITVACEICGVILTRTVLSFVPEGEALTPFITSWMTAGLSLGADATAGAMTARTLGAELEEVSLQNEAADAKLAGSASKAVDSTPPPLVPCPTPNSFTPNTPVVMADGSAKTISNVSIGDSVLATDPVENKTEPHKVTQVIQGEGIKNLVDVRVDGGDSSRGNGSVVTATDGHPFWVESLNRWIEAKDLQVGERLHAPTGQPITIAGLSRHGESTKVYNLTVEGIHTYYVKIGNTSVLVHNSGPECILFPNNLPGTLDLELGVAERFGVSPSTVGSSGFDAAISAGTVKWAILENGTLVVEPKFVNGVEISHAVLSRGGPVRAAGEADIAGSSKGGYFGLDINDHSGHFFRPGWDVRQLGVDAFSAAGVHF